mgnify:CR=1 FL=1
MLSFVRVGTLDDPDRLPPDIHIFTASKQPWVVLPPGASVTGATAAFMDFNQRLQDRLPVVIAVVVGSSFLLLVLVLLLLGANFRQLFSLAIFAEWLFYMIAGSTIFVFRQREPQAMRPYRMWGYPFVPVIFVAVAAALLCYTFKNDWPNSGYGMLVILAGIPLFAYFSRQRRARGVPDRG